MLMTNDVQEKLGVQRDDQGQPILGDRIRWLDSGVIEVADFTDGGSTAGTYTCARKLPKGALVVATAINVLGKFLGDVSAELILGDGSDTDRWNGATNYDVFTAAGEQADCPFDPGDAGDGVLYCAAETSVVLTITTSSDFTLAVTNGTGSIRVCIGYIPLLG